MFASADPSAFFDFSISLEVRVAGRPQCPAHSSTDHTWGFSINFNLHPIFNNQGLHLVSQFYPCWFLVLCSLPSPAISSPSSFWLSSPHFLPILQLSPCASTVVVGNGEEARTLLQLRAQASTGNTPLLLLHTVGASQEHSFHFKRRWAPASSGVEHIHSFFREFIWCQPRTQLGISQQWSRVHFAVATAGDSEN